MSGCVQQQLIDFQKRELKNQQSLFEYASTLIHHYARTLVVQVDLSIKKEYQALYNIQAFNQALEVLHRRIADQDTCFSGLHGYAWALEHGISKGYHCHFLFIYNGSKHMCDGYYAKEVGEIWRDITNGDGCYFSCNRKSHKDNYLRQGTLGIGTIQRNRDEVEKALNAIGYLASADKEDQHLRAKIKGMRCFG